MMDIKLSIYAAEKRDYPKELTGGATAPRNLKEAITREQSLRAMTINVARQFHQEHRLGSIEYGKIANMTVFDCDFLLLNQDVLTCPVTEIHNAKPAATYFEGKKVYPM